MQRKNEHTPSLDTDFLLLAYCNGYFPMASGREGAIEWYSPDPRAIIPLERFKISRSLRQTIRKKKFDVRFDTSFEAVMRACADRADTWISEDIVQAYIALHRRGFAHSVECWKQEALVGGLYGVSIRGAFFGESMFSRMTDASKVALAFLVEHLHRYRFALLDTQFMTNHLRNLGAIEIPRAEYLQLLSKALDIDTRFLD